MVCGETAQAATALEQLPTGSPRSSSRSWSGAVTITPRRCPSASRRTSTALRRAISSSRSASRRSPDLGSASVSLASAARAVRAASSASSLPRRRRSARGVRLISSTVSLAGELAGKAGAVAAGAPRSPTRARRRLPRPRTPAPLRGRARSPAPSAAPPQRLKRRPRPPRYARPSACDADHVIHLVCNHPLDPPASLVGSAASSVARRPSPSVESVSVPAVFTNGLPEPSSAVPIVSTARRSACNRGREVRGLGDVVEGKVNDAVRCGGAGAARAPDQPLLNQRVAGPPSAEGCGRRAARRQPGFGSVAGRVAQFGAPRPLARS
jgi:hypothetical protein